MTLTVQYPGGIAQRLRVFYRTRGVAQFSEITAKAQPGGNFEVVVPGAQVQPPGLEYYAVALDENGAPFKALVQTLIKATVALTSTLTVFETFTPGQPKPPGIEVLTPHEIWTLPTYREMLFVK